MRPTLARPAQPSVPPLLLRSCPPTTLCCPSTRSVRPIGLPTGRQEPCPNMPRLGDPSLACLVLSLVASGCWQGTALGARLPRSPIGAAAAAAAAADNAASTPASLGRRLLAVSSADGGFLELASQNGTATDGAATNGHGGTASNGHAAAAAPLPEPLTATPPAAPLAEPATAPAAEPATEPEPAQQQEREKSLGQKLGSAAAGAQGWGRRACGKCAACVPSHVPLVHGLPLHIRPSLADPPALLARPHTLQAWAAALQTPPARLLKAPWRWLARRAVPLPTLWTQWQACSAADAWPPCCRRLSLLWVVVLQLNKRPPLPSWAELWLKPCQPRRAKSSRPPWATAPWQTWACRRRQPQP